MFLAGNFLHQCVTAIEKRVPRSVPVDCESVDPKVLRLLDLLANYPRIVAGVINLDMVWIAKPRLEPGDYLWSGLMQRQVPQNRIAPPRPIARIRNRTGSDDHP